jgi:hypothetical protein
MANAFGVKLSIDNKVIAKLEPPQKKEKHPNALILHFKKKWIK